MLIVLEHQVLRTLPKTAQDAASVAGSVSDFAGPSASVASPSRRVVVIGNFDGVHRGHQELFAQARSLVQTAADPTGAPENSGQVVALTFWPHPTRVLAPAVAPPLITSRQRRRELLSDCGVDVLIEQPFDLHFASLSPTQFVLDLLRDSLRADAVCVGYDFNFGKGRSGNTDTLRDLLTAAGIQAAVVPAFSVSVTEPTRADPGVSGAASQEQEAERAVPTICSSSGIRKAVQEGRLDRAAQLLGRRVEVEGVVEHGAARGRQLGFPTANLRPDAELTPVVGIYAAWAELLGPLPAAASAQSVVSPLHYRPVLARYPAAVSVGYNATFTSRPLPNEASPAAAPRGPSAAERGGGHGTTWPQLSIEAHLIQPAGADWLDLYGQTLRLQLVARLRDEQRFPSIDALKAQIAADVAQTTSLLLGTA